MIDSTDDCRFEVVNIEYQPPSYAEDHFFNHISIRRRSSAPVSHPSSPPPLPFLPPLNPHRKYLLEKGCMCVFMCVCGGGGGGGGGGAGGTGKILPSPSFLFIHLLPLPHSLSPAPVVQVSYSRMHCIWLLMPITSLF